EVWLATRQPEGVHDGIQLGGRERARGFGSQGEEALGMAGVARAAGRALQLVVDSPALGALCAEHVKPAGGECVFLESRDLRADLSRAPRVLAVLVADILEFVADPHVGIAPTARLGAPAAPAACNCVPALPARPDQAPDCL